MKKYKSYKYRLYPNKEQENKIIQTFGCSRFVYNYFLNKWQESYTNTKKGLNERLCSKELPLLKKEFEWLKNSDSIALQKSVKNLSDAYGRFYKGLSNLPKHKTKKKSLQSYQTNFEKKSQLPSVSINGNRVKVPKLGWVRFSNSRNLNGRIINATIQKRPSGKYFIILMLEIDVITPTITNPSFVGIDLGLKELAILSNGNSYKNLKAFKELETKLAKEQKILSKRKTEAVKRKSALIESKNYQKQKIKVAKIHEKIANKRKDYLQKVTSDIVKNHDVFGIEDLKVSNLLKNKKLSKSILDASWSQFRNMLEYKADFSGKTVIVSASNFPSTQLCSVCRYKNVDTKNLNIRDWECPKCGSVHDRDVNAAINLMNEAIHIFNNSTAGEAGLA